MCPRKSSSSTKFAGIKRHRLDASIIKYAKDGAVDAPNNPLDPQNREPAFPGNPLDLRSTEFTVPTKWQKTPKISYSIEPSVWGKEPDSVQNPKETQKVQEPQNTGSFNFSPSDQNFMQSAPWHHNTAPSQGVRSAYDFSSYTGGWPTWSLTTNQGVPDYSTIPSAMTNPDSPFAMSSPYPPGYTEDSYNELLQNQSDYENLKSFANSGREHDEKYVYPLQRITGRPIQPYGFNIPYRLDSIPEDEWNQRVRAVSAARQKYIDEELDSSIPFYEKTFGDAPLSHGPLYSHQYEDQVKDPDGRESIANDIEKDVAGFRDMAMYLYPDELLYTGEDPEEFRKRQAEEARVARERDDAARKASENQAAKDWANAFKQRHGIDNGSLVNPYATGDNYEIGSGPLDLGGRAASLELSNPKAYEEWKNDPYLLYTAPTMESIARFGNDMMFSPLYRAMDLYSAYQPYPYTDEQLERMTPQQLDRLQVDRKRHQRDAWGNAAVEVAADTGGALLFGGLGKLWPKGIVKDTVKGVGKKLTGRAGKAGAGEVMGPAFRGSPYYQSIAEGNIYWPTRYRPPVDYQLPNFDPNGLVISRNSRFVPHNEKSFWGRLLNDETGTLDVRNPNGQWSLYHNNTKMSPDAAYAQMQSDATAVHQAYKELNRLRDLRGELPIDPPVTAAQTISKAQFKKNFRSATKDSGTLLEFQKYLREMNGYTDLLDDVTNQLNAERALRNTPPGPTPPNPTPPGPTPPPGPPTPTTGPWKPDVQAGKLVFQPGPNGATNPYYLPVYDTYPVKGKHFWNSTLRRKGYLNPAAAENEEAANAIFNHNAWQYAKQDRPLFFEKPGVLWHGKPMTPYFQTTEPIWDGLRIGAKIVGPIAGEEALRWGYNRYTSVPEGDLPAKDGEVDGGSNGSNELNFGDDSGVVVE